MCQDKYGAGSHHMTMIQVIRSLQITLTVKHCRLYIIITLQHTISIRNFSNLQTYIYSVLRRHVVLKHF